MATLLRRIVRWHGPIWSAKIAAGRLLGIHPMNWYLRRVSGIIHVGANAGQERDLYAGYGLDVLWIEPIPSIFDELRKNISAMPKQRALNCLVTDRDGAEYTFNIANNNGQSSSMLEFGRHTEIWPEIRFYSKITLRSVTLDTLLRDEDRYQALVLDTQGSELLVLNGATQLLSKIRYVTAEAADFESYIGCARVDDIVQFLGDFGFKLIQRHKLAESSQGGQYFDLLFRKRNV
jgi:FkbM family methyltransferase